MGNPKRKTLNPNSIQQKIRNKKTKPMALFPKTFLFILIISALVLIGISSVILAVMFFIDLKNKKLW